MCIIGLYRIQWCSEPWINFKQSRQPHEFLRFLQITMLPVWSLIQSHWLRVRGTCSNNSQHPCLVVIQKGKPKSWLPTQTPKAIPQAQLSWSVPYKLQLRPCIWHCNSNWCIGLRSQHARSQTEESQDIILLTEVQTFKHSLLLCKTTLEASSKDMKPQSWLVQDLAGWCTVPATVLHSPAPPQPDQSQRIDIDKQI